MTAIQLIFTKKKHQRSKITNLFFALASANLRSRAISKDEEIASLPNYIDRSFRLRLEKALHFRRRRESVHSPPRLSQGSTGQTDSYSLSFTDLYLRSVVEVLIQQMCMYQQEVIYYIILFICLFVYINLPNWYILRGYIPFWDRERLLLQESLPAKSQPQDWGREILSF